MMQYEHAYEFGPYRLLLESRRLLRAGQPVALTSKIFDLLVLLIESRGTLLGRTQLVAALWLSGSVGERNLTQSVFMLRKALNEEAGAEC